MLTASRGTLAIVLVLAAFLSTPGAVPAAAPAASADAHLNRVVIAVFTDPIEENLIPSGRSAEPGDRLLRSFVHSSLAVGLMSSAQGDYRRDQALLDLTQGSRQPSAVYHEDLARIEVRAAAGKWRVEDWDLIVERARGASTTLRPGLLGDSVPGGAAYVAGSGEASSVALLAAGLDGQIEAVSLGDLGSLPGRTASVLEEGAGLAVVELPNGHAGRAVLGELLDSRTSSTLVMAIHLPPSRPTVPIAPSPGDRFYSQTAFALTDGGQETSSVRSATTRQPGLVAAVDIAPTALDHLGSAPPLSMRGQVIEGADLDPSELEDLRRRWSDIRAGRQSSAVSNILLISLGVWAAIGIVGGIKGATAPALRILGLALMWFPATALLMAAFAPRNGTVESLAIAASSVGLAALIDRLLPWPRAPLVPAAMSLFVLTVDLARGGALLTSSVLGPSVSSGNRFYGLSNEIEPLVPALALLALAGGGWLLAGRGRRVLVAYVLVGVLTAAVVGVGRLGADVGGVVTVAGAFTVGGFIATGRRVTWRLAVTVVVVATLGVVALVLLDFAFGSRSHLANNLSRLSSPGEFWELFARRYQLAGQVALQPANLVSVVAAIGGTALVIRNRELFLPNIPSRLWLGALVGTVAGGLAGALSNDSGPVLLINGTIAAAAGVAYLAGIPLSLRPAPKPEH